MDKKTLLQKEKLQKQLEANYQDFKKRPSVFLLGKGYCSPSKTRYSNTTTGLQSLGIRVTIPGNCSYTYEVTSKVPSAVVTYFHNVITDDIRNELQVKINKAIEATIEKCLNKPEFVLEMLGLQSEHYFLHRTTHYPKRKIVEIEEEIQEERFKVIDKFTEAELMRINRTLAHSNSLLLSYAKDRKLNKLLKKLSNN
jgi:hypothetical protein